MADTGGPAFPVIAENGLGHIADGMTLRDYFAAKALQGLLACPIYIRDEDESLAEFRKASAKNAYAYADAMIRARK